MARCEDGSDTAELWPQASTIPYHNVSYQSIPKPMQHTIQDHTIPLYITIWYVLYHTIPYPNTAPTIARNPAGAHRGAQTGPGPP